ncbi:conserved hypothetical protein [delta proteobacterium NaphS2]|nr:conserved hypothetical protein [delta proteobacterium NaphS2]
MGINQGNIKIFIRTLVALGLLSSPLIYLSYGFSNGAKAFVVPNEGFGLLWWEIDSDTESDEPMFDWKGIRKERLKQLIDRGKAMSPRLRWGDILRADTLRRHDAEPKRRMIRDAADIWVRDADGRISRTFFNPVGDNLSVNIPNDLELNGLYLLGVHLDVGEMDIDLDGAAERIHLSAKRLLYHRKATGHQGNERGVFFNDPDKLPLEIGFSDPWFRRDYQRAYREYGMKVLYQGKPLKDAEVHIISGSGWRKTVHADSAGEFLITPFGNMEDDGREEYLYVACYHDVSRRAYHCATLAMNIRTYPEWLSRSHGFMLWTILGTGLSVLIIIMGIWRKKKHTREAILKFENQRIKKG